MSGSNGSIVVREVLALPCRCVITRPDKLTERGRTAIVEAPCGAIFRLEHRGYAIDAVRLSEAS